MSPVMVEWLQTSLADTRLSLLRRDPEVTEKFRYLDLSLYPDEQVLTLQILGGYAFFMLVSVRL